MIPRRMVEVCKSDNAVYKKQISTGKSGDIRVK